MKKIILGLTVLIGFIGSISFMTPSFAQDNAIWIDVRTQEEWDQGHIENAILIPYQEISAKIAEVVPDKNRPINLYCRSGRRSTIAQKTLERLGYTNVQNLGAYNDLKPKL